MKHGITGRNYVGAVALTVGFSLLLSGCAAAPPPKPMQAAPPPVAAAPPPSPAAVAIPPGFDVWLGQLRTDAVARGISKATVDAALTGLAPLPRVLELDRQQPEYSQTFWRYLDSAVSPKRISDGQAALQQHAALLRKIEQQYGVPARFLVAFWGLETNYGKGIGGFPTIAALATLAYDGRRSEFFRGELFNALTIVDRGHIAPAEMIGSWAGAMGQTQFMPSTFLRYGVDADQDGRIDIWRDIPDALTSAANYLKSLGWDGQHTWGREVTLPASFDVGLASLDTNATDTVKTLREWSALGLRQSDGALLPQQDLRASLVLPGGRLGPAFLVYDNYRAILKWNRSMFYAVAVGYLADRLTGGAPLAASHRNEEPLRREEVMSLQEGLHRLGHLSAEPDGVLGGSTRQAVRAFQRAHQIQPDGYASRELVATVARESGVSPPAKPAA